MKNEWKEQIESIFVFKNFHQIFCIGYHNSVRTKTAKTKEEWKTIKKKLTGERGLWKMEILDSSSLKWKIDKTHDCYHRRLLLKIDQNAHQYLNQSQFSEIYSKSKGSYSPSLSMNDCNLY